MSLESIIRSLLILKGDVRAVAKNKVPRRVARRIYGRATGSIARKVFK